MPSITDICNIALSHVGKPTINDPDDQSEEARQCKLHYGPTKDSLLQSYPWRFATKVQALGQVTNDWSSRWEYAYQRPTDCLKIIRIIPESDIDDARFPTTYEVRASGIYCGISPVTLEFICRLDDPSKFSPLFVEALSWALAAKIVTPLTRDQSLRKDAYQLAANSAGSAMAADANEEQATYGDHAWPY